MVVVVGGSGTAVAAAVVTVYPHISCFFIYILRKQINYNFLLVAI